MPRSVLVTGGAGFIGHHVVGRLLETGCAVAVIDNFSAGKRALLAPHKDNSLFSLFEGDLRNATFVKATLESVRPEAIVHLAAIHFIPHCEADAGNTIDVNVRATQVLLDALTPDTKHFIFSSTGDVYAPSDTPHSEDAALGSLNIYGLSKQMCEELMAFASRRNPGVKFTVLRLFNAYGPGETNPHVLPDIFAGLRAGGPLFLGNLTPLRDYVYVGDIANAIEAATRYSGTVRTMNIGTGAARSVAELLDKLSAILGRPLEIKTNPARLRASERQRLIADPARANAELGWRPQHNIDEALRKTLAAEGIAVARQ